jgi:hypothetical protein
MRGSEFTGFGAIKFCAPAATKIVNFIFNPRKNPLHRSRTLERLGKIGGYCVHIKLK